MDEQTATHAQVLKAFADAGLPEVGPSDLEPGMYTNAALIHKFRFRPDMLISILRNLPKGGNASQRRAVLSHTVEAILGTR